MMMLTEIINNSTSAIQRRRIAQDRKQSAEAYTNALSKLNTTSNNLKATLECASTLEKEGIIQHSLMKSQTRDELLESINSCGQGLYDGSLTSEIVALLKTRSEAFWGQLQAAWKTEAAKYSDGVKGYLGLIGGLSEDPQKAKRLEGNIASIVQNNVSINAISQLVENVAQAKIIVESFALNPTIEIFLKKVSTHQATIADLDQNVMQWLKDKNLINKLKINF